MQESIKLAYYRVNKISFAYNEQIRPDTKFQIKPKFECKLAKRDKMLIMTLGVKVENSEQEPAPFNLEVNLLGTFALEDFAPEDSKIQMRTCLTQLMPFLRSSVASITANCNIPAYFIPFIDVSEMANNAKDNQPQNVN